MSRRVEGVRILAALAALGLTLLCGRAEAGPVNGTPTSGGITVTGGVTQGGDPQFTYYLDVYLVNATIPAYTPPGPAVSTLSLSDITGITSAATFMSSSPYDFPSVLIGMPALGTGTVDIDFFNTSPISTTGTSLLLQLVITTPTETPAGLAPGDTFAYAFTIGSQSGGGTVTMTDGPPPPLVPEPSSLVLMLVGGTVAPCLGLRYRRRPPSRGDA